MSKQVWIEIEKEQPTYGQKVIIENEVGLYWAKVVSHGVLIEGNSRDFVAIDEIEKWIPYPENPKE